MMGRPVDSVDSGPSVCSLVSVNSAVISEGAASEMIDESLTAGTAFMSSVIVPLALSATSSSSGGAPFISSTAMSASASCARLPLPVPLILSRKLMKVLLRS